VSGSTKGGKERDEKKKGENASTEFAKQQKLNRRGLTGSGSISRFRKNKLEDQGDIKY